MHDDLGIIYIYVYVYVLDMGYWQGRVACEMNTCDELIATEIVFNNILEPMNPPEVAGVLAALVFQVGSKRQLVVINTHKH